MSDTTSLFDVAIIVVLALVATTVVVLLTRRPLAFLGATLIDWCRDFPARLRAFHDSKFRRERNQRVSDAAQFQLYNGLYDQLQEARTHLKATEEILEHVNSEYHGRMPEIYRTAVARREMILKIFTSYFIHMSDAGIASLARGVNVALCGGNASPSALEDFFRDEQQQMRSHPALADTHLARLTKRFAPYLPQPLPSDR